MKFALVGIRKILEGMTYYEFEDKNAPAQLIYKMTRNLYKGNIILFTVQLF